MAKKYPQMLVCAIRVTENGKSCGMPVAYCLMPGKRKEHYHTAFKRIKDVVGQMKCSMIYADFEQQLGEQARKILKVRVNGLFGTLEHGTWFMELGFLELLNMELEILEL